MTTTRRRLLRLLAVTTAAVLALSIALAPSWLPGTAGPAAAAERTAFTIRDPRVTSASGLTRDVRSGLYWTVDSTSSEGTVFGVSRRGDVRGIFGFRARPTAVEAVAMHRGRLYVADIGDRGRRRGMITVYFFDNPRAANQTVPYRAYDFAYPDGAHDAKTLLVDPSGRLLVVTNEKRAGIYAAPDVPSRRAVNQLRRVADAPAYVTDGAFLPGSGRIAVRTYVSTVVLDAQTYRPVARARTPYQKKGESLAVSLDGRSLLLGSAGAKSPVLKVGIPRRLRDAPTGTRTPPPRPQAKPAGEQDTSPEDPPAEAGGPTISRSGTLVALAVAGLVALAAGVVVAARRR